MNGNRKRMIRQAKKRRDKAKCEAKEIELDEEIKAVLRRFPVFRRYGNC